MSSQFEILDRLKATLDQHRPLDPAIVANLRDDLILRWTYHSNTIEGNTLIVKDSFQPYWHSLEIHPPRSLSLMNTDFETIDALKKEWDSLQPLAPENDNDPKQAREILAGLSSDDIDPIDRRALETRISNAKGKVIASSISDMESTLSEVKSKLGGEVLQILADGKVKTDSSLSLSRQTAVAADIKLKIDQSAELPEARASLTRLAATITSVTAMHPSTSQMSQINGIKAEVKVLRLALK